jgi:hypothetical protein
MADIKFKGCADFSFAHVVLIPYGEGSTVFVCAKARAGQIEKIVIKQTKVLRSHKTWGQPIVQYFDTHNRIWFGHELCLEADALASAEAFYVAQAAAISALECPPN